MNLLVEALLLFSLLHYLQVFGLTWWVLVAAYILWKIGGAIFTAIAVSMIRKAKKELAG